MQLDFLFDVESVERETIADDPDAIVSHFTSGEFSAEVWTDAAGMTAIVEVIVAAHPKAERPTTSWQPQPVAIYGPTVRPQIELGGVEVFPPVATMANTSPTGRSPSAMRTARSCTWP